MFHKNDLDRYTHDNAAAAAADCKDDNDDSVGPSIAAIQWQQAKKAARLLKNDISNLLRVIVQK